MLKPERCEGGRPERLAVDQLPAFESKIHLRTGRDAQPPDARRRSHADGATQFEASARGNGAVSAATQFEASASARLCGDATEDACKPHGA
jgi:hypothetical protein